MFINKLIKKQVSIIVFTILIVSIVLVGSSYALFEKSFESPDPQTLSLGTLEFAVSKAKGDNSDPDAIDISSQPITEEEATDEENTDNLFAFVIKNTGTLAYSYTVSLINNPDYLSEGAYYDSSRVLLNHNYIRYKLNDENSKFLGNQVNDIIYTYVINPGETQTFTLRVWVPAEEEYRLPNSIIGQEIHLSLLVDGQASEERTLAQIYNDAVSGTLLAGIRSNYASPASTLTNPGQEVSTSEEVVLASTADDYGTSYYFRGAVENNYVVFADMCWRIVRIDGLGNIKLVLYNYNSDKENVTNPCASTYDGTSNAFARDTSGTQISTAFNSSSGSNAYVGLMYGSTATSATYEETHANTNKSTILTNLETWYDNNLASYENKLANVIWCNDKSLGVKQLGGETDYTNTGIGKAKTFYGATERLVSESSWTASSSATPTLVCPDSSTNNDNYKNISRFTIDVDEYGGNGALDKPIGLLTADEIAFAGSCYGSSCANSTYYLYKNASSDNWWTASPMGIDGSNAYEWYVHSAGNLYGNYVNDSYGLRPVVSLKSTTTIVSGGVGSQGSPYVVQ